MWKEDDVDLDLYFREKTWKDNYGFDRYLHHGTSSSSTSGKDEINGFELDLDDLGTPIPREYHIENINLKNTDKFPNGDYEAFVKLYKDGRSGSERKAIPFQVNMKGLGGQSGALACDPSGQDDLACSFASPAGGNKNAVDINTFSSKRRTEPMTRAQFEFKVTDGHLKLKWPDEKSALRP